MKMMKQLTRKQVILIGVLLLLFALLKVVTIWYWQSQKTEHKDQALILPVQCNIRQGCPLPNGVVITFDGKLTEKAPFNIVAKNIPASSQNVHVSFSMKNMEMGFNRYKLLPHSGNTWVAEGVRLPICVLQLKEYVAEVTIDKQYYEIPFKTD